MSRSVRSAARCAPSGANSARRWRCRGGIKLAREQLDELLNFLIPFAQQQLDKHGTFYPFGAGLTHVGEVAPTAVYEGNEHPQPEHLIKGLIEALRAQRDQYAAAGICFDARVIDPATSQKTDAIAVDLEGPQDQPVTVYLPYSRRRFGGVRYGEIFASAGKRRVFDIEP